MFDYVYFDGDALNVYSDNCGVDYYFRVKDKTKIETAKEIAEKEFGFWASAGEGSKEPDYYYNAGYWEVVKDALDKAGIETEFIEDKSW